MCDVYIIRSLATLWLFSWLGHKQYDCRKERTNDKSYIYIYIYIYIEVYAHLVNETQSLLLKSKFTTQVKNGSELTTF